MHPLLSFNATYTGIMVSYGFYHKHQGWAFSFPYIRSAASSILFYVTFYQLHMPSQDVIPHQFSHTSTLWSHLHSACFAILTTDKYLDDCPCCKTANEVCSAIWMGKQEWISSFISKARCFPIFCKTLFVLAKENLCAWKDAFVFSKVYLAQTFALAKLATYAAIKIPT